VGKPVTKRRPRFTAADRMPKNKNGIEHFYRSLLAFGITLNLDGDRIEILAPHGNVSPTLEQAIERRKSALLPLLRERE
jgi:hypothetical protein